MAEPLMTIVGLEGAQKLLDTFIPQEMAKAHGAAVKEGAEVTKKLWRQYLSGPRTQTRLGVVTGRLRDSPTVKFLFHGGRSSTRGGGAKTVAASVSSDVFYGPFHEFGTRFLPRRPHLAPAVRDAREPIRKIMAGKVAEGVRIAEARAAQLKRGRQTEAAGQLSRLLDSGRVFSQSEVFQIADPAGQESAARGLLSLL